FEVFSSILNRVQVPDETPREAAGWHFGRRAVRLARLRRTCVGAVRRRGRGLAGTRDLRLGALSGTRRERLVEGRLRDRAAAWYASGDRRERLGAPAPRRRQLLGRARCPLRVALARCAAGAAGRGRSALSDH